jgi:hypothetical protein
MRFLFKLNKIPITHKVRYVLQYIQIINSSVTETEIKHDASNSCPSAPATRIFFMADDLIQVANKS